jgi:hypothetical protein
MDESREHTEKPGYVLSHPGGKPTRLYVAVVNIMRRWLRSHWVSLLKASADPGEQQLRIPQGQEWMIAALG